MFRELLSRIRDVVRQLTPSGGVTERTIKSGIWVTAMNAVSRILQLLLVVVLARLLDPNAFGLMGIVLLALGSLRQFSDLGLNAALIQQKADNVDRYLDTVLTMRLVRGMAQASILLLVAPFVGSLMGEPEATPLIRATAVVPVIRGLRNPGIVYFEKNLDYHLQFVYTGLSSISHFAVGVGWAIFSPTVWALVIGYIASDVTRLVLSYLIHDYRPRLRFTLDDARELFGYGKWISGGTIVYFLYSQGDDAVVGWLLSAASLGLYQVAYRFANAPATELAGVIRNVTFSAYSKVQNDTDALREGFFRTYRMTTLAAFPMAVGILAAAPTFVRAVLGPDWTPMVTTMRILAVYGLLLSGTATFGPVWKAIGRPDIATKIGAFRVVLLAVTIYPVTITYGIEGTAALITGIYLFPIVPIDVYYLVNAVETSYTRLLRESLYPMVASAVMGVVVVLVQRRLVGIPALAELALLVALGVVVYTGGSVLLDRRTDWGLRRDLGGAIVKIRS